MNATKTTEPQTNIARMGLPRKLLKRQKDALKNNLRKQEQQAMALADKKAAEAQELESLVQALKEQVDMLRKKERECRETAAALAKKLSSIDAKK